MSNLTNKSMNDNSRVNFNKDMGWGYIEGFRKVGYLVAKQMLEDGKDLDYLVYPLGFLYRHHVELQLKWLDRKLNQLSWSTEKAPNQHELTKLWDRVRAKLKKQAPSPSESEYINQITKKIKFLAAYDGLCVL